MGGSRMQIHLAPEGQPDIVGGNVEGGVDLADQAQREQGVDGKAEGQQDQRQDGGIPQRQTGAKRHADSRST